MTNTSKPGPRLIFDRQYAIALVSDIVNYIGDRIGYRRWMYGLRPRMPVGGVVKRILVEVRLRKADAACGAPLPHEVDTPRPRAEDSRWLPRFSLRKRPRPDSPARGLQERISDHIVPMAQLFEHQEPATFRGWMRAGLDHFIRRYREADQEAANADYKSVFLEAEQATVMVKRMRPRRGERKYLMAEAETADTVAAALPPSKDNLSALKDRADTLLPLLKGNEVTVFECLRSTEVTSQRDIVKATGLTEGAVSKILDRIIKKAG
jgi:hypothetical protein